MSRAQPPPQHLPSITETLNQPLLAESEMIEEAATPDAGPNTEPDNTADKGMNDDEPSPNSNPDDDGKFAQSIEMTGPNRADYGPEAGLHRSSIENFSNMSYAEFKNYVSSNRDVMKQSVAGITSMKHSTWGDSERPSHLWTPLIVLVSVLAAASVGVGVGVGYASNSKGLGVGVGFAAFFVFIVGSFVIFFSTLLGYMLCYSGGLANKKMPWCIKTFGFRCNLCSNLVCRYFMMCCYNPCECNVVGPIMDNEANDTAKRIRKLNGGKGPEPGGVCWLGDSEFTYWHNLAEDMKPFHPNNFNAGFGGSRIVDIVNNIDKLCLDWDPETVILHAAGNDFDFKYDLTFEMMRVRLMDLFQVINAHPSVKRIGYFLSSRRPVYSDEKWDFMIRVHQLTIKAIEESEFKDKVKIFDLRRMRHPIEDFAIDRSHLNEQGHTRKAKELLPMLLETWPPA